jgi:hypothetical protein
MVGESHLNGLSLTGGLARGPCLEVPFRDKFIFQIVIFYLHRNQLLGLFKQRVDEFGAFL